MSDAREVCRTEDLPPGAVTGAGKWAVGNDDGKRFAVSRRCRHMIADMAEGSIEDGCLVCPRHGARYDVNSGRMVRGPQGIYAKVPGLEAGLKAATKAVPLARATVIEKNGMLSVEG